eukprot:1836678-Rhodomonas_salina.2
MMSLAFSPTLILITPSSQPLITCQFVAHHHQIIRPSDHQITRTAAAACERDARLREHKRKGVMEWRRRRGREREG